MKYSIMFYLNTKKKINASVTTNHDHYNIKNSLFHIY